ncbi:MAG: peroxiredoxin [Synergistaceae bacterium]|jgi:peroxiredoxin Q/BCP|nr:peroxiredoxin [Synergistaceae bacterium]
MIEQGKTLPAFDLADAEGKRRTNAEFLGRWLALYFYPKDNTSGCTSEAQGFAELYGEFQKHETAVVGVSPDDIKSHAKFSSKLELPFPLLSDPDHVLLEACGVWRQKKMYGREYMGVARTTLLVDPEGVVRELWEKVKVTGHAAAVLEKLIQARRL